MRSLRSTARRVPPAARARRPYSGELRETRGCSVHRLRPDLRGRAAPPPQARSWLRTRRSRVFINDAVCEGCGDCSTQSNCVSIEPLETELGRKRTINQSSCNKDLSCLDGLCPAFVTVTGGSPAAQSGWSRHSSSRRFASCRCRSPWHSTTPWERGRDGYRWNRRGHDRRPHRHGGPPRTQGRLGARHDGARPEGRRRRVPRAHRLAARRSSPTPRVGVGERPSAARL